MKWQNIFSVNTPTYAKGLTLFRHRSHVPSSHIFAVEIQIPLYCIGPIIRTIAISSYFSGDIIISMGLYWNIDYINGFILEYRLYQWVN